MATPLHKRSDGIVEGTDWDALTQDFLGEGRNRYPASYVVFKAGATVYAQNGETGELDFSGADATAVINAVLGALTVGRDWREKIVVKGNYEISSTLTVSGFTSIELIGEITLADNSDCNMIELVDGDEYIEIYGGHLDGNKTNNAGVIHGIAGLGNNLQIWIHEMKIYNMNGDGINVGPSCNVWWINDNRLGGNGRHGIGALALADSMIDRNQVGFSGTSGIGIGSGNNNIVSNFVWNSGEDGIFVGESRNTFFGNRIDSCDRAGIYLNLDAHDCIVSNNRIYDNGQDVGVAVAERAGIYCRGSDVIIESNTIYDTQTGSETQYYGITLSGATDCIITDNKTFLHVHSGIIIKDTSDRNIVTDNHSRDNGVHGINIGDSDFNMICNNWLYNNAVWGVDIFGTSTSNTVKNNRFSGNVTGMLGDAGADTELATKAFCFVQHGGGSGGWTAPVINTTPGGIDIDANDEFAYVHITLPEELQEITRIKIWAYSNVVEAANNMLLRLVAHGATSNEAWSGNAIDVVNKESEETGGIAVGDVIHWVFDYNDDAQIRTLAAQDFMEILAVGEVASAPDVATDALFGGVEIEYV